MLLACTVLNHNYPFRSLDKVYFNPSFQGIFPIWHKFYGVQLHVLYVVLPTQLGSIPIVSAQQFIT